ncbi:2-(R)-hydroxypropyl-CoM dehydrogenase (plasmid) [Rhodococcus qingshengii]|uniref:SDR family NAD(P)-dependent oxidoreductase n=1 Tax=Rhodococcus qingshengii TaxID=334542 RepID=UPI0007E563E4|nr:glucose 1-dehydrogenase [Rhodococcus qingshengii]BCF86395.1 2-(R)-hydroxypropyl-CoM dehydrogenase [Rhodococcus qingshengii]
MTGRLAGKTAVITGAGTGIGRSVSGLFAREGARVAALDVNLDSATETVASIEASGGSAAAFHVDVADPISVDAVRDKVLEIFDTVDILVNNAGVSDNWTPMLDTTEQIWARTIGVNLTGPFLVSKAFLPTLIAKRAGSIINIASIGALIAGSGGVAYTSSKAGVTGLTRQMTMEFAPIGVRTNAILPGVVETAMAKDITDSGDTTIVDTMPARRFAKPEEIANLALYLASDESSYSFGGNFVADGGWTAL